MRSAQAGLASVELGAQDVSAHASGAYTGEVSAAMLKDFACRFAIVGHSERRQYHGETDQLVADKAKAALASGITPIVCVGETWPSAKRATPKKSSSASWPR
jgi:triosephosphate isomerase